jgi:hypothetical protein
VANRATLKACLGSGLATLAFFGFPLLLGATYFGLDFTRSDVPMACAIKANLARGDGLWLSREMGNGSALFAQPNALLLYPLRWLLLPFSAELAASLMQVLHLAIGAFAATWLARTMRLRPGVATAAGVTFALTGTAVDLILHSSFVVGVAWLPLSWAAARRALGPRRRAWHLMALAGALVGCMLGGDPHAFCMGAALCGFEGVACMWRHRQAALRRAVALLLTVTGAFGVGLLQWSAYFAEAVLTTRGRPLRLAEALDWSFSPPLWLAALWPNVLTEDVAPGISPGMLFDGPNWNPTPYVGPLLIAAAIVGISRRQTRSVLIITLAFLVAALGDQTEVLPLAMRLIPPISWFRYPAKYLLPASLGLTMLAALGFGSLRGSRGRRRMVLAGATMLAGNFALLAIVWVGQDRLNAFAAEVESSQYPATLTLGRMLLFAAGLAVAPLAVATAVSRIPLWGWRLVPWITAVGLAVPALRTVMWGERTADVPALMSTLSQRPGEPAPVICTDSEMLLLNWIRPQSGLAPDWHRALLFKAFSIPEMGACGGVTTSLPYSALTTRMQLGLEVQLHARRVAAARALGCSHVLSTQSWDNPTLEAVRSPGWAQPGEEGPVLFRLRYPLATAFVVRQPLLVHDDAEIFQHLGLGAPETVIDDPLSRLEHLVLPDGGGATGAEVRFHSVERADLLVEGKGAAVIGVRTAFMVGWHGRQAGRELPVVRSAGNLLAVVVPDLSAGKVELRYFPPGMARGFWCAFAGLVSLGIAFRMSTRAR